MPRHRRFALRIALLSLTALMTRDHWSARSEQGLIAQSGPISYAFRERWQPEAQPPGFMTLAWPRGHEPGGLGFDAQSSWLFATDLDDNTVRVYDNNAAFRRVLGGPGTAAGLFDRPRDVAVIPESPWNLAVSDAGNDRVQIIAQDGSPVAEAMVLDPAGIVPALAYDPDDAAFYVVSRAQRSVIGFDASGSEVRRILLPAAIAPEGLAHPEVLIQRAPGTDYRRFLVADPAAGMIHDVVFQGGTIRVSEPRFIPDAWAVAGGLAVRAGSQLSLHSFGGVDRLGLVWLEPNDPPTNSRPFDRVTDLEMTGGSELYATVLPEGLVYLGGAGNLATGMEWPDGRLLEPERLAAGAEVLVGDSSPFLQRLASDGRPAGRIYGMTPILPPVDLAVSGTRRYVLTASELVGGRAIKSLAADGSIERSWQGSVDVNHQIQAIAASGDRLAVLDLLAQEVRILDADLSEILRFSITTGGFKGVMDIALSADRVYLSNQQTGELEIWRTDGGYVTSLRVATGPIRIAARDDGLVLVLTGADWIFAYGPDGEPMGAWPAGLPQEQPVDLDLDEAGRLYVLDAAGEVRVYAEEPAVDAPLPPPVGPDLCSVVRDKGASPRRILLGETVEVALVVEGTCPLEYQTADVVLTIDTSGSMGQENKMAAARNAAVAFLAQTDPLLTQVGLVNFAGEPNAAQSLTGDRLRLIQAVNGLRAEGGTRLVPALEASIDMVTGAGARADANRVIVFMSDGKDTDGGSQHVPDPPGLIEAKRRATEAGVHIFTIGLGSDADARTLERMASDPGSYYFSPSAAELRDVYVQIARRIEAAELFQRVTVVDEVPDNMTFMPGTGIPVEPSVSPDGKTLTWQLGAVYEPGFRLTYRLRPEEVGLWPTNKQAWADFVDGFGNPGRTVFPVPEVLVEAATATPTPTHTPSLTPTDGPSPTPTLTPTPAPAVYLPILLRERCDGHRLHIVLLIDTSSSMRAAFGPGAEPKIEAARQAALRFLELVDLGRDAVAVLAFDGAARLVASGRDRANLEAGIRSLKTHEGTRIDLGLAEAAGLLAGPQRLPGSQAVIVLLSDGAPQGGSEPATRAGAAALRAAGVPIFTMAVGQDAARDFLAELAGDPKRAYFAPDARALTELYAALASRLAPCLPSWQAP